MSLLESNLSRAELQIDRSRVATFQLPCLGAYCLGYPTQDKHNLLFSHSFLRGSSSRAFWYSSSTPSNIRSQGWIAASATSHLLVKSRKYVTQPYHAYQIKAPIFDTIDSTKLNLRFESFALIVLSDHQLISSNSPFGSCL